MKTDRQTDGRTDMTKLTVAFGNFSNAPKNRECPNLRSFHGTCME